MNIGDYVRTNDGYIYKIKKIPTEYKVIVDAKSLFGEELEIYNIEIIKSSPNIIDLIKENDYVKLDGRGNIKYWRIVKGETNKLMIEDDGWNELDDLEDEEITGIITCEQMKNMEYKVGD